MGDFAETYASVAFNHALRGGFHDLATLIEWVVTSVSIGLQVSLEVFQVPHRMLAFAVGRVLEPDGRRRSVAARLGRTITRKLMSTGVEIGERTSSERFMTVMVQDPDGNRIALAEAFDRFMAQ